MEFEIVPEGPAEEPLLEPLLDRTFGLERHRKTVYRLREGLEPCNDLRFVAHDLKGVMLGSLRFWPVRIGETPAVLFGPLAVEPALQGLGIGRALVAHGLAQARARGWPLCVIVGDPAYYRPYGFHNAGEAGLELPGPVEPERFQVLELVPGSLRGVTGLVGRWEG